MEVLAPEMVYGSGDILESLPPVSEESLHSKSKPVRAEGMVCIHGAHTCHAITAPRRRSVRATIVFFAGNGERKEKLYSVRVTYGAFWIPLSY